MEQWMDEAEHLTLPTHQRCHAAEEMNLIAEKEIKQRSC